VTLDAGSIETYQRDGVVCLRDKICEHWLDRLRDGVEASLSRPSENARHYNRDRAQGFYFAESNVWRNVTEYEGFIRHSPSAQIAAELMGSSRVNIFCDDMFIKDGQTPEVTPWHHDMPYFPLEGDQVCSIWVALDDVPLENSVEYIAGSHRWGRQFRPRSFFNPELTHHESEFPDGSLEPIPDFDACREQLTIRAWAMRPGDIAVFHGLTVHGSPGNSTNHRRRGFISRWCGDDVVYAWKGEDTYPRFPNCELRPGDALDSDTFPLIWSTE
jgi:ectoine hydroxylase-related dioxygenase (phytanoyl-CoA dioxygenase family)